MNFLNPKIILFIACFLLFGSCSKKDENKSVEDSESSSLIQAKDLQIDKNGLSKARVVIKTAHGNIVFKFYPMKATGTVTRFIQLTNEGFYDGLKFHRVVPNFVVQGGDPLGTGMGGSGVKLKAEFNNVQHVKGTVAMARSEDPNSADSQFYIALTTLPSLDGKYTVFGQVVEGLDLLEKIQIGDKMISVVFER
ncbi:peptidylprolyl isomerase [Bacteriovoracaceae bacterium]|nr:peptidylprolyl isomerase [Bacteriovoracaceae bacterium]|tara:strand:- start:35843 stop:36424 length:582 start_codon:yes stop_codon:yes gene_type:complete